MIACYNLRISIPFVLFCFFFCRLRGSSLVPFGRSLGGAVAISLAHRYSDNVKGIIVENTFLSIPDMVDVLMPWAAYIKHLVLRISWNSGELIKNLKHPILFISGDSDELVPPHQMRALYQNAGNSEYKDFYEVRRGTHNDTWVVGGDAYYDVSSVPTVFQGRNNYLLSSYCLFFFK